MSHIKYLSPLAACVLMAFFATPAIAQVNVDVAVDAETTVSPTAPAQKPLDFIKARAQQIKQGTPGVKAELRGEAGMGTGVGERNMNKERMASTSDGMRGLKALIMMHGGAIKNRFNLAINHLNRLLDRMDTRLEKMAAEGIDTAAVVTLHSSAEVAVVKAEADAKAVADFAATASDATDRTAFKTELETKLRTAHQSVKAAHKAVMDTVRALVQLAKTTKPNASVETETTVETDVQ